jgi:hypothetical protein
MKYRKLRIAWSVGWGAIVLFLVVCWVRSNWYVDEFWISRSAKHGLGVISANNCASVAIQQRDGAPSEYIVGYSQIELKELQEPQARTFLGFAAARDGDLSFVNVPYWILVTCLATLGMAPRIRWRFSLRTLLIATTLVAVVLGLVV